MQSLRVTASTDRNRSRNRCGPKKVSRTSSSRSGCSSSSMLTSYRAVSIPGKLVWMRIVWKDDTISNGGVFRLHLVAEQLVECAVQLGVLPFELPAEVFLEVRVGESAWHPLLEREPLGGRRTPAALDGQLLRTDR